MEPAQLVPHRLKGGGVQISTLTIVARWHPRFRWKPSRSTQRQQESKTHRELYQQRMCLGGLWLAASRTRLPLIGCRRCSRPERVAGPRAALHKTPYCRYPLVRESPPRAELARARVGDAFSTNGGCRSILLALDLSELDSTANMAWVHKAPDESLRSNWCVSLHLVEGCGTASTRRQGLCVGDIAAYLVFVRGSKLDRVRATVCEGSAVAVAVSDRTCRLPTKYPHINDTSIATWIASAAASHCCLADCPCFFVFCFPSHIFFSASGQAAVSGVVPSPPRYVPSVFIVHKMQHSHCSSIFIECCFVPTNFYEYALGGTRTL